MATAQTFGSGLCNSCKVLGLLSPSPYVVLHGAMQPPAAAWLVLLLLFLGGKVAATKSDTRQFHDSEARGLTLEFESEGGRLESWKSRAFEDADVAAARRTLKTRGLWLPSYVDFPAVKIVTRGSGRVGTTPPHTDHLSRETTFPVRKVMLWLFQEALPSGGTMTVTRTWMSLELLT